MRLKRMAPAQVAVQAGSDAVWPFFKAHARTLFSLFIGFGLIGAANFVPFSWLAIIIIRTFGESAAAVGLQLGKIFAIGSLCGVAAANVLARFLSRVNPKTAPLRVAQIGALIAIATSSLYLLATTASDFYWIAAFQLAASFSGLVLSPTLTQNVTPRRIRARLIAIGGMFYIGFGALSPLLVGFISDQLGSGPRNLLHAMLYVALPAFSLGVLILQYGSGTLAGTLDAVKEEV